MAIQLFIDTNAYLSFYHFTKDDISELVKLHEIIAEQKGTLHLPEQVRDEWRRNRDSRLSTAAKEFQKTPFATEIPRHMQSLQMAKAYSAAIAEAKKAREHLIAEATARARTFQLDVDLVTEALFGECEKHDHDDTIFAAGKIRAERGNPPGKPDSYGDQYNWEMLLAKLPDGDLYLVTKDGDYVSVLDGKDDKGMPYPNAFLKDEWQKRKKGNLYVFESIKGFLAHYEKSIAVDSAPEEMLEDMLDKMLEEMLDTKTEETHEKTPVEADARLEAVATETTETTGDLETALKLPKFIDKYFGLRNQRVLSEAEEVGKATAIHELVNSTNFNTTHKAIRQLVQFEGTFTAGQANMLLEAALMNNQIAWIISDDDVNTFYMNLLSAHISDAEPKVLDAMIDLLGIRPEDPPQPGLASDPDKPQLDDNL